MGVPAEKATDSARSAADELRYVLAILARNPDDIYNAGIIALEDCRRLLSSMPNSTQCQPSIWREGDNER